MKRHQILLFLVAVALACNCALAQSTNATLQGTVTDPSDLAVPNVTVELKNVATGFVRTTISTSEGIFRFNAVPPTVYDLTVRPAAGFKEYVQRQITLNASEIRELGRIRLAVGTVTESVEVTAAVTPVQTASSENAASVDFNQMQRITVRGRDLMSLLQTIPGVTFNNTFLTQGGSGQSNYETVNPFALGALNINGRGSAANFTVDGVTAMDMAGDSLTAFSPNVDAVAEIRVLATNYQAEYGRAVGGQVQVVTKSGTQEYHGSLNVNKRHEMFNANSWFNNNDGKTKPFYRFMAFNYAIGGPAYIPKVFNTSKNKVFFHLSQEFLGQRSNPASGYANVPNPNHRKGDFSYFPNSQGNFISNSLRDPVGGTNFTPWAGAASGVPYDGRQNFAQYLPYFDAQSQKWGQAMLAALPLPNLCNAAAGTSDGNPWNGIASGAPGSNLISPSNCPSWITSQTTGLATGNIDAQGGPGTTNNNTRNYYWIYNGRIKRRNDVLKVDVNLTEKITASVRYGNDYFLDESAAAMPLRSILTGDFEPTVTPHPNPGKSWAVNSTYTITPTMVNQLTLGYSWNDYAYDLNGAQLDRGNMLNPPSFHDYKKDSLYNEAPQKRPLSPDGQKYYQAGFPSASFGGSSWSESGVGQPFCNGTCPNYNFNPMYSASDSISKVYGTHNFKAGVYWEWNQKVETAGGNSQGTYSFSGSDDPFFQANTRSGFANAFLGNIRSYTEGQRVLGKKSSVSLEAFFQDSWRVSRNFTLDLGVRFSHLPAMQDVAETSTMFVPSTYNPALASRIFYPYCTVSTANAACPNNTATTKYQYSWDKAMNPNAVIGTGMGGPGNMYPSYVAAGSLVPMTFNGVATGYSVAPDPYTGMQRISWDNPYVPLQNGVYQVPRFSPAIRIGFAWDVFGDGKTAIRGGFGQNLRRMPNSIMNARVGGPPVTLSLRQDYGTIASVATNPLAGYTQDKLPAANQVVGLTPFGATSLTGPQPYESTYNGSFEIQKDIGISTVVKAGYVMVLDRHSSISTAINPSSLGTPMGWSTLWNQIQPAALDPTTEYLDRYLPGNANNRNLSDNYFRSMFPGYSGVTLQSFGGSANVHSLQASVRRNFTERLSYSMSYTWLKRMSLSGRSEIFEDKVRNYGPSYSPTPMHASFTYVYQAPNLSDKLSIGFLKWVTDDWELSGFTQLRQNIRVGIPTIGLSNTNSTNLVAPNRTGTSAEGARMVVVGDWKLPSDQVSFVRGPDNVNIGINGTPGNALINNAAFMFPNPCSLTPQENPRVGIGQSMECFGNAGPGSLLTIPGTIVNNWDMTFRKKFPIKGEGRTLEFRAEIYNIFNHTQFISASIGQSYVWADYKNTGKLTPTNGGTNRYTNTVNPRIMSFALRLQF